MCSKAEIRPRRQQEALQWHIVEIPDVKSNQQGQKVIPQDKQHKGAIKRCQSQDNEAWPYQINCQMDWRVNTAQNSQDNES